MATYLRPGVFVEETLQALTDPSLNSGESVAAFVGTSAKGGPIGPTLITSWSQYQALFGDARGTLDEMAFSVYSFFNNGGSRCYIVRTAFANATAATLTLNDGDSDAGGTDVAEATLTVTAKSPGTWASASTSTSRVYVTVQAGQTAGRFDFIIEVGDTTTGGVLSREQYLDVTLDPADPRSLISLVNSPTVGSDYVFLTKVGTWGPDQGTDGTNGNPAVVSKAPLTGGSDGSGTLDYVAAVARLDSIEDILNVNLPGVNTGNEAALATIITAAAARGDRFIVIDGPKPGTSDSEATQATALTSLANTIASQSSYAAIYGPWTYIVDPTSAVPGALRLVAPGGAVLGQYARNDATRGIQKAPAGTGTSLRVVNLSAKFTDTQLDTLNQKNINIIRSVPGAGFCIMGARTLATRQTDRNINVRRALMFLKYSVVNQTRFAIFEQNDEELWNSIRAVLEQFLTTQFQQGVLAGNTPRQAFYVKCDDEINRPQDVAAGVVNVEVGVALSSPAEFVVIRIGQFDGGATVDEVA